MFLQLGRRHIGLGIAAAIRFGSKLEAQKQNEVWVRFLSSLWVGLVGGLYPNFFPCALLRVAAFLRPRLK